MIQISRASDTTHLEAMTEHFVVPGDKQELFAQQLAQMIDRPDVLVLVAESDKNGLVGFIVAQAQLDARVVILQAWCKPTTSWDLATELHNRIMLWAISQNKSTLEVRTARSAEAMFRRFGFEESALILTHDIPADFTQRVLDALKEPAHG